MIYEFVDNKKRVLRIRIQDSDDLWLLYMILKDGDIVTMKTLREVKQNEGGSSSRIPMVLSLSIKHMEFQPFTNRLRIRGIVIEGPDKFGILGSHHTFSVDVGTELLVEKQNGWSEKEIKLLERGSKKTGSILIVAIDYDEVGVGVFRRQGLHMLYEKELRLPGKGDDKRDELLERVLTDEAENIKKMVEKEGDVASVLIVGPGFLKERLAELVLSKNLRVKVVTDSTSMGGISGVKEAVSRGKPAELLLDEEIKEVTQILDRALKMLAESPNMIAIGLEECEKASLLSAVDELLVLDELLTDQNTERRTRIEMLLNDVIDKRGRIHVVPYNSPAGEKLYGLSGIVCLLRFPAISST